MSNTIRIKRRLSGSPGAPTSLQNAELAFNEVDSILYYGVGTGGAGGSATSILAIGGPGGFVDKSTAQSIGGVKTFTSSPILPTPTTSDNSTAGATTAFVKAQGYITGNQTITLSGDASGSGTTAITLTLSNSGVVSGTYNNSTTSISPFTVDAKGRITNIGAAVTITPAWSSITSTPTTLLGYGITDAYTKTQVDSAIAAVNSGLDPKASVRAISTSNITLSGTQTVDGVSLVAGDRVLVVGQTTSSENGIYVVAAGAWSRSTDANTSAQVTSGMYAFVSEGTTYASTGWILQTPDPITLGTTGLTFIQFTGAGEITVSSVMTKTGNTIGLNTLLTNFGGTSFSADSMPYMTSSTGVSSTALTSLARTLLAGSTTGSMQSTLGLGTLATQNANSVSITGGSITNLTTFDGTTLDCGTY